MLSTHKKSKPVNILTVDLEDWPQSTLNQSLPITSRVFTNTNRLLAIFSQCEVKATFFVLGKVAEAYPELIASVADAGHEIATHGYGHELVFNLTPSSFLADITKSIHLVENVVQKKVLGYRAPDFSLTEKSFWAFDVLAEQGIKYDSSIFPINGFRYGIPSAPRFLYKITDDLYEVPLSTVRIAGINLPVCGGGYFRLMPYWLTRRAIRHLNSIGESAVVYFHPYELDSKEIRGIREKIPLKLRVSQDLNRRSTEEKLRALLTEFEFKPIEEVIWPER